MRLLDVGTGPGIRAVHLAQFLNRGRVIGLDTSESLLKSANRLAKIKRLTNIEFLNEDISDVKEDLDPFDFIHIRLVIQHLREPLAVLEKCRSLLKKGGVIFIEDTDRDWMTICPAPPNWPRIYERVKSIQREMNGDPNAGQKLAHLLIKAGFKTVQSNMIPVTGGKKVTQDWVKNYAPSFFSLLPSHEAEEGFQCLKEIEELNKTSEVFFYQTWFQASGRR